MTCLQDITTSKSASAPLRSRDFLTLNEVDCAGKQVLVRMDLNAPVENGRVTSDARLRAALPTLRHLLATKARITILSHLGRPQEGRVEIRYSLRPVADTLSGLLGIPVPLISDWPGSGATANPGVTLAENVRFLEGETANDPELGRCMARKCDVFVMDAFGTAHRAHASTHAVAEYAPVACAGPLLTRELDVISSALAAPKCPVAAIVGGSKVSTKLNVLHSLIDRVNVLILGGGIANTFLAAFGHGVGSSLHEPDLLGEARTIMSKAMAKNVHIPLPIDLVCADAFSPSAHGRTRRARDIQPNEMILDIGLRTAWNYAELLSEASTIFWNGPVGVFEFDHFGAGTRALATAIAGSSAFSIAGGGDTLAAIDKYGVADGISYISTGGGAFLEMLEGRSLPAVDMLKSRAF